MAAPVNTVAPSHTGSHRVGRTLTGADGTWEGSPTFAYQWQRAHVIYEGGHIVYEGAEIVTAEWEDIGSATSSTYVIAMADHRCLLRLKVTGTNGDGSTVAYSDESEMATAIGGGGSGLGSSLGGALRSIQSEEEEL